LPSTPRQRQRSASLMPPTLLTDADEMIKRRCQARTQSTSFNSLGMMSATGSQLNRSSERTLSWP
jgi:hypothetical protein